MSLSNFTYRCQLSIINYQLLIDAFEKGSWVNRYYLDTETGDVVCVTEKVRGQLQLIYDEVGEFGAEPYLDSAPLQLAHLVEMDDVRFRKVPECSRRDWLETAESFAETVPLPLQKLLWTALDRADPVQFERLLTLETGVLGRWQQFKQDRYREKLSVFL